MLRGRQNDLAKVPIGESWQAIVDKDPALFRRYEASLERFSRQWLPAWFGLAQHSFASRQTWPYVYTPGDIVAAWRAGLMPANDDPTANSTAHGVHGAQEIYRRVRAFFELWPFRPIIANAASYLWLQVLFPSRLPSLSAAFETGIPDTYTLIRRALPGDYVVYTRRRALQPINGQSLCACIIRTRHGHDPCPAIARLLTTELYDELEAWIDDTRTFPEETPEFDPGPVCALCRTATHGRDFAQVLAANTVRLPFPMLVALMELSSLLRVGPYRIIRYGISCLARGDAASGQLPAGTELLITHQHYTSFISWARSPAYDAMTHSVAAKLNMPVDDAVRLGIAIAIDRLARAAGPEGARLLTQRNVAATLQHSPHDGGTHA